MSIAGVDNVQSRESVMQNPNASNLGKDEFLTMLVAQLQAQDPMNPMDSTSFTAQLAQFSSLEQLQSINQNIQNMENTESNLLNTQTISFIGQNVTAYGNSFTVTDGVPNEGTFNLNDNAANVFVRIYDEPGNLVNTIETGPLESGNQTFEWQGRDMEGNLVQDGTYSFELTAVDRNDEVVDATTFTTGYITGVTFQNGYASLLAGDLKIPVSNIVKVIENEE